MTKHAGLVEWREWGEEAFREASGKDKVILLDISAVWCHWCHVMDETSYSDPEIAGIINERFVPVRVDTDRMPDVNERYNMGGWPTTAFLTPTGEVLIGATYVPPDKLKETIYNISEFYSENRDELKERIAELRAQKQRELDESLAAAQGELPEGVTEFVLGQMAENYDPEHGGFGTEPKFSQPEVVELLLCAYRDKREPRLLEMAEKTLHGMAAFGMYDHVMGGFFRYSVTRDWSVPHFEKMTESNAGLIINYTNAYRLTKRDFYIETVRKTLDYVDEWLWDPAGYFRGSQDADEQYYGLSLEERLKRKSPYLDTTPYANFNARMAAAYMTACEVISGDCRVGRAYTALDFVLDKMTGSDGGLYHYLDGTPQRFGLLTDHVAMLRALLLAYQLNSDTRRLDQAIGLVRFMDATLWDAASGGYFDLPQDPSALGALSFRSKPFLDNADAAVSLKTLAVLTGDDGYADKAVKCLLNHANEYKEYGYMASGYALASEFVAGCVTEVVVAGDKGAEMDRLVDAALNCYVPCRVLRLLYRGRDDAEIAARGYGSKGPAAAYICRGSSCSAKITEPDALVRELDAA